MYYTHSMNTIERNRAIKDDFKVVNNLSALGRKYGVSRERIRQIVHDIKPKGASPYKIIMYKRITCYICRNILVNGESKYCGDCRKENKLEHGRDLVRGVVRGRDNNTCQSCGFKWKLGMDRKRLDVHHLEGMCGKKSKGYDSIYSDLSKLITVCHKCHYNLHDHAKYGLKL